MLSMRLGMLIIQEEIYVKLTGGLFVLHIRPVKGECYELRQQADRNHSESRGGVITRRVLLLRTRPRL